MKSFALVFGVILFAAFLPGNWSVRLNFVIAPTFQFGDRSYTGSAVWSLEANIFPVTHAGIFTKTTGEAIRLPIEGRAVYMLKRREAYPANTYGEFPRLCDGIAHRGYQEQIYALKSLELCTVEASAVSSMPPALVEFLDPTDPSSMRLLSYQMGLNANGQCPSVCLLEIAISRTELPLSTDVLSELEWVSRASPDSVVTELSFTSMESQGSQASQKFVLRHQDLFFEGE
ncbi:hypothetical protein [Devosia sp.]|uniref:hypothetical protein n=1 Tax=Devosia sp. TaxID=1871048 RepID=UPI002732A342|nr:hypothetical protein [Devosia sp.]MDP2779276.1 hypothetical protein [Devosia sp.]